MSVAWAFVKRDFAPPPATEHRLLCSSRASYSGCALLLRCPAVWRGDESSMQRYGNDYFAFLLIGVALSDYLGLSLNTFSASIREGRAMVL